MRAHPCAGKISVRAKSWAIAANVVPSRSENEQWHNLSYDTDFRAAVDGKVLANQTPQTYQAAIRNEQIMNCSPQRKQKKQRTHSSSLNFCLLCFSCGKNAFLLFVPFEILCR
jgi:hypothetical protein